MEEKKKLGRPYSKRTREVEDLICEQIATGKPLAVICREINMDRTIVYDWMNGQSDEDKDFSQRFARARDVGFDAIAEDCLDIADNGENDTIRTDKGDIPNTEWMQRSKLRVETRLKLLAKWSPKKYGDKLQTEFSGELGIKQITGMEVK